MVQNLGHSDDAFPLPTNVVIGSTISTQNMGSTWNRMDWTKPWGKESNTVAEDPSREENNATSGKGEKDSGSFEPQKLAGNVTVKSPGINQSEPPVSFKTLWHFVLHLVFLIQVIFISA